MVQAVRVAGPGDAAATPRAGGSAGVAIGRVMPPRHDFHRVYFHWFTVAPHLLANILQREDIPEHVRDLVFRRGPTDEARQRMDVAFQNAMAYVTDPRLRTTHASPRVSD